MVWWVQFVRDESRVGSVNSKQIPTFFAQGAYSRRRCQNQHLDLTRCQPRQLNIFKITKQSPMLRCDILSGYAVNRWGFHILARTKRVGTPPMYHLRGWSWRSNSCIFTLARAKWGLEGNCRSPDSRLVTPIRGLVSCKVFECLPLPASGGLAASLRRCRLDGLACGCFSDAATGTPGLWGRGCNTTGDWVRDTTVLREQTNHSTHYFNCQTTSETFHFRAKLASATSWCCYGGISKRHLIAGPIPVNNICLNYQNKTTF